MTPTHLIDIVNSSTFLMLGIIGWILILDRWMLLLFTRVLI